MTASEDVKDVRLLAKIVVTIVAKEDVLKLVRELVNVHVRVFRIADNV